MSPTAFTATISGFVNGETESGLRGSGALSGAAGYTGPATTAVNGSVTPYLIFSGADEAIAFYKRALGAEEVMRMDAPGGRIGHAEIKIGDSRIMLADEHPEIQALSPRTIGGSPISIHLYVENVDAAVERAVSAGAKLIRPVSDQFYGDRTGGIEDPFGYRWFIATHKEDLTMDEVRRRAAAQHS